jgi:hypothetical protein
MVASGKLAGYKAFLDNLRPHLQELNKPHIFKFWYDIMPEFFDAINAELKLKAKAFEEWADLATKPLTRETLAANIALQSNPEYQHRMFGEPITGLATGDYDQASRTANFLRGSLNLNRWTDVASGLNAARTQATQQSVHGKSALRTQQAAGPKVDPMTRAENQLPMWQLDTTGRRGIPTAGYMGTRAFVPGQPLGWPVPGGAGAAAEVDALYQ